MGVGGVIHDHEGKLMKGFFINWVSLLIMLQNFGLLDMVFTWLRSWVLDSTVGMSVVVVRF